MSVVFLLESLQCAAVLSLRSFAGFSILALENNLIGMSEAETESAVAFLIFNHPG